MDANEILIATRNFFANDGTRQRVVRKGQLARAGHPVVTGNEDKFVPVTSKVDFDLPAEPTEAASAPRAARRPRASRKRSTTSRPKK